jgi:hypothetical protein
MLTSTEENTMTSFARFRQRLHGASTSNEVSPSTNVDDAMI